MCEAHIQGPKRERKAAKEKESGGNVALWDY